ncbi:MAG TPA: hypothetical protein PKB00_04450, partial [Microthrixaceae bacterium]|nr:hypothetical protein [Microthrixaceae bacterium]
IISTSGVMLWALLAPVGDAAALADRLRRVLGDPAEAARQRDLGWERVQPFDVERLTDLYLQRYHQLVAG